MAWSAVCVTAASPDHQLPGELVRSTVYLARRSQDQGHSGVVLAVQGAGPPDGVVAHLALYPAGTALALA